MGLPLTVAAVVGVAVSRAIVVAGRAREAAQPRDLGLHALDLDDFVPAPGQGALALEARAGDSEARHAAEALTDPEAMTALHAERALSAALEATCRTPIGAHAVVAGDELELSAFVGLPDGSAWVRDRRSGPISDPEGLGVEVAERLRAGGADEILRQAEALAA